MYYYLIQLFLLQFNISYSLNISHYFLFFQLQQQHKHQEVLFLEKETAVAEAISLREKLAAKETEIQRESKRRQKTHLELMDVR